MYMKKIYSISAMLMLSMLFSIRATAQCAPGTTFALIEGNTNGNCNIRIITTSDWVGADIEAYNIAGVKVTTGTNKVLPVGGPFGGFGIISFICSETYTITSIELKLNGNVCNAEISSRIILPIKLSAFNASVQEKGVSLNWTSEVESGSSHFGVEKSTDGKNFTTIGIIKAAGVSNSPRKYSFEDKTFAGTAFYRLKLVDIDGKSEYSKTVYVNGGSNASSTFSVFPNPFRSDVQLKGINASDVNKNNIRVFSVTGKEVGFRVTGSNSISIDASLPQGVYILRVKNQSYKLIKE